MPSKPQRDVVLFFEALNQLKKTKGDAVSVQDIQHTLYKTTQNKDVLLQAIKQIAGKIEHFRVELGEAHPDKISGAHIPDAHLELDAIVKATEEATNKILDNVEKIQAAATSSTDANKQVILEHVTAIFEACNFQDITGQRVRKVIATLIDIDRIIKELMEALGDKVEILEKKSQKNIDPEKELMRGPQLDKDLPSQDDIDKLFSGN